MKTIKEDTGHEQGKVCGLYNIRGAHGDGRFHSSKVIRMDREDRQIRLVGYTVAAGLLFVLISVNVIFS